MLGLVCYVTGVWMARIIWREETHVSLPSFRDDWSSERFRMLLLAITVVAFGAYLLIGVQMGIPGFHFSAAEKRLDLIRYGKSQSIFLCGAWTVIVFLSTRLWIRNQAQATKAKILLAVVVASLLVL